MTTLCKSREHAHTAFSTTVLHSLIEGVVPGVPHGGLVASILGGLGLHRAGVQQTFAVIVGDEGSSSHSHVSHLLLRHHSLHVAAIWL